MNWEDRKKVYNAEYYDGELDGHYRDWWWTDDFVWGPRARVVYELYRPRSVLVCGCAKGSLVHYLFSVFGVDAHGFDLSEYAIGHTPFGVVQDRLRVVDAAVEPLPYADMRFDVVVAFDVIEHIDGEGLLRFVREVKRVARNYMLVRAPMCVIDDCETVRVSRELAGLALGDRWGKIVKEPSFRTATPNPEDAEHPNTQDMQFVTSLFKPEFEAIGIDPYFHDILMGSSPSGATPVLPFYETLSFARSV